MVPRQGAVIATGQKKVLGPHCRMISSLLVWAGIASLRLRDSWFAGILPHQALTYREGSFVSSILFARAYRRQAEFIPQPKSIRRRFSSFDFTQCWGCGFCICTNDFAYGPVLNRLGSASGQLLCRVALATGKTTFIRHLLQRDFPGMRIGPEPTTVEFSGLPLLCFQHQWAVKLRELHPSLTDAMTLALDRLPEDRFVCVLHGESDCTSRWLFCAEWCKFIHWKYRREWKTEA